MAAAVHLDPSGGVPVAVAAAAAAYYDENIIKSIRHNHNHKNVFAFDAGELQNRSWLQTIIDSSHLITFGVSILVIVYGSFRSLSMDRKPTTISSPADVTKVGQEKSHMFDLADEMDDLDDDENDNDDDDDDFDGDGSKSSVQTIDSIQALFIPVVASLSLLFMFFFFDSIQTAFVICTSVLANIAFYYLLCPVFQNIIKSICSKSCLTSVRINLCLLGKYTLAELLALLASSTLVLMWIVTGHWLLMNIIGIGFCITFIAIVRLPSLKVSTLLLVGLVVYDVVWVYFSHLIFNSNVMVKVATKEADNPVAILARKLNIEYSDSPKLSLPGKLVVPSYQHSGNFSILGLGDIVVPGLLLCFVLRFDAYKRSHMLSSSSSMSSSSEDTIKIKQPTCSSASINSSASSSGSLKASLLRCFRRRSVSTSSSSSSPSSSSSSSIDDEQYFYSMRSLIRLNRITYFHCSLIGYFVGLITATVSSEIFREAQPALLFLVPFTLLPLLIMAYIKGDLRLMWNEPFNYKSSNYFYV